MASRWRELAEDLELPSPESPMVEALVRDGDPAHAQLDEHRARMHTLAREAFVQGDAARVLGTFSNERHAEVIVRNVSAFLERGAVFYARAVVVALTSTRTNLAHVELAAVVAMLDLADRDQLQAAGDPLPLREEVVVYRGVADVPGARRERGVSWTQSLAVARWFSRRSASMTGCRPLVYRAAVRPADAWFWSDARGEAEAVLLVDAPELVEGAV